MKEEDDVDDEEEDDRTRQILSNQFGRVHSIYIYAKGSFDPTNECNCSRGAS